jgi:hypothetical protein
MAEIQEILLVSFIFSHLFCDYILFTRWNTEKSSTFIVIFVQSFLVGIISFLLCGAWNVYYLFIIIFVVHFLIDFVSRMLKKRLIEQQIILSHKKKNHSKFRKYNLVVNVVNQITHLFSIIIIVILSRPNIANPSFWVASFGKDYIGILILVSGFLITTVLVGHIIDFLLMPFQKKRPKYTGYPNGGKVIGWLERSLIFLLLILGETVGVGVLIAAKTAFQLGIIQKLSKRKEAEYILIGTLLSFGIAIISTLTTMFLASNFLTAFHFKIFG